MNYKQMEELARRYKELYKPGDRIRRSAVPSRSAVSRHNGRLIAAPTTHTRSIPHHMPITAQQYAPSPAYSPGRGRDSLIQFSVLLTGLAIIGVRPMLAQEVLILNVLGRRSSVTLDLTGVDRHF